MPASLRWYLAVWLPLAAPTALVRAQAPEPRTPLDPANFAVVYDIPATARVELHADLPFQTVAGRTLTLDLYRPPGMKRGELRPAVIFINAIGDRGNERVKRWEIYRSWPRLVAAHGLIGISMDADPEGIQGSIRAVFRYLVEHGVAEGVDVSRLGVYAASANVTGTIAYLASDSVSSGIRAAALYYGGVPDSTARMDLPTLFIVAESDVPRMGPALGGLWQRIVDQRAPWTLQFASGLPHAFDALADTDDSRRIIQQTIAFWMSHLNPMPAPPWRPSETRAIVASVFANQPERSVPLLERWTAAHPGDAGAESMLGRGLTLLQRYPDAERVYQRAYALDSTDVGVLTGLGMAHLNQRHFAPALDLLERARQGGMENSYVLGQIGWAQLNLQRNADAAASYERAFQLGIPPGRSTSGLAWYNLACAYSRLGRVDDAFRALDLAVSEGMRERATYEGDDDFRPLRTDPRFRTLLARLGSPSN